MFSSIWLKLDIDDSILGFLHHVVVVDVADGRDAC
jgi:hypothetical protein